MRALLALLIALAVVAASCAPARKGDLILRNPKCPEDMVAVPGGPFIYGDPAIKGSAAERVYLRGFCIDRYEHPNQPGSPPTVNVTWLEAGAECQKIGKRLCTEFEWEKAARGPSGLAYPYGVRFDAGACRYFGLRQDPAYRTGTHIACKSSYGVFDMSGGVWEWTENPYKPGSKEAVVRGGYSANILRLSARAAYRGAFDRDARKLELGFRCCSTPPGPLKAPKEPEKKNAEPKKLE